MINSTLIALIIFSFISCESNSPTSEPALIDGVSAKNLHEINPDQKITGSCYSAFKEPRRCMEGFAGVSVCSKKPSITPLRPNLKAVVDEGCYYFCPNVPNCLELSMDEVAQLACKFAAANGISDSLGLRSVCGPETQTSFGSCCWGLDANTWYD
jgi:hypothetical protein